LGGGFGGVHTFLGLKRLVKNRVIDLTIIDQRNYFLFTPLLHEVVSERVGGGSVKISLSELLKKYNANFLQAKVWSVDLLLKEIKTNSGILPYDILVIALGSSVNFFGVRGADSLLVLKTLYDAELIKKKLNDLKKKSENKRFTIVVVGGGATGVELIAEIADIFPKSRRSLLLLEAMDDILPDTSLQLREVAKESLTKRGVKIMLNSMVESIEENDIKLTGGDSIVFDIAIWATGVKATDVSLSPEQSKSNSNRLQILPTMQLERHPYVFVLGDIADGYPMTAQIAVGEAKIVASNIKSLIQQKHLSDFVYISKGMLFSLGRWMAGAEVKIYLLNKVIYFWGPVAWLMWHFVYIIKIPGIKNKFKIMWNWLQNFLIKTR